MKFIFKKSNGTILEKEFSKENVEAAKADGWIPVKDKPKRKKAKK